MKTLTGIVVGAALVLFAAGCSKASAEGKYVLDNAAMQAELEKSIARLPAEEQGMAKFAAAMVAMMKMEVQLQKEGKLVFSATKPSLGKDKAPKVETKEGTWKQVEKKLILSIPGDQELSCETDGKALRCPTKDMSLVFVKA